MGIDAEHRGSDESLEDEVARLREENARLSGSLEEARELIRIAPAFVGFVSVDGLLLGVNERSLRLGELPLGEVLGQRIWESGWWRALPHAAAQLQQAVKAGAAGEVRRFDVEYQVRHGGVPSTRWAAVEVAPQPDESGAVARLSVSGVDITDRKAAEAHQRDLLGQAEQARSEAETANRAKYEFLAVLGHELRNPLAPIMTALHLMRLRAGNQLEKERAVIESQAQHLVHLVDDLLDVSRITRGKIDLKQRRVQLAEVVARAIELASPILEKRQHDLKIDVPAEGLAVDADVGRLAQAVANLVTNAAKYTKEHGLITIEAKREAGEVVLRVRDSGVGIAPEMLPRIFDMFVQERQPLDRSQGGLGLGLTIVRSLVELHGGRVDAASGGPGKGSEFSVALPAVGPAAEPRPASSPDHGVASAPQGGRRILIVDDNEDAAEMMGMALELTGHVTQIAHDGPSALKVAAASPPEVALLDIGLPVMDGYELARRLREQFAGRKLVLIAVTGYGQEEDRDRSQGAGFDAHMVKPIDLHALSSLIKELTADKGSA